MTYERESIGEPDQWRDCKAFRRCATVFSSRFRPAMLLLGVCATAGLAIAIAMQIDHSRYGTGVQARVLSPPLTGSPVGAEAEEDAFAAAETVLARNPPTPNPLPERLNALSRIDEILQQEDAADHVAVQRFFHRRIGHLITDLRAVKITTGATIWQVYNHGFVVRTRSATVCFDLVRAKYLPAFAMEEAAMTAIVEQCDALFVSHVHADHAETFVAQSFVDRGKPVVAPEQVGYREPLYSQVIHLKPDAEKVQRVPIQGGATAIHVIVYPGHQGVDIDNNVVLVRLPDGISIAHTGDQWEKNDFDWIDHVADHFRVDVLLPNDWTYDIARLVQGFNPRVLIPGHANELGHSVEKRQPYTLSFQRKIGSSRFGGNEQSGYPQALVVAVWGESYHYEPAQTSK